MVYSLFYSLSGMPTEGAMMNAGFAGSGAIGCAALALGFWTFRTSWGKAVLPLLGWELSYVHRIRSLFTKRQTPPAHRSHPIEHKETIVCAAVWVNTHSYCAHQPSNVNEGFVVAGVSHTQCFGILEALMKHAAANQRVGQASFHHVSMLWETPVSGFITSRNRFVDRTTAFELALVAGQLAQKGPADSGGLLRSSDLY